ncbi:DUF1491 family protein [Parvularcula sp. IMCC14364]|uniref:DUF1491 family protein n=1 Tax=Parvularcula sp. IMCC14364 TaxID=3067902 RepID=UPI00274150C8|nr:DUF1491 family protein [Parvularcula sp. IMCC14364]
MLRLKTAIFIKAWLRRAQAAGAFAAVVRKGDPDGGLVIVKVVNAERQACAWIETYAEREADRWRALTDAFMPEGEIDEKVNRELKFDSDAWLVEAEDRAGRNFLDTD